MNPKEEVRIFVLLVTIEVLLSVIFFEKKICMLFCCVIYFFTLVFIFLSRILSFFIVESTCTFTFKSVCVSAARPALRSVERNVDLIHNKGI